MVDSILSTVVTLVTGYCSVHAFLYRFIVV